MVQDVLDEPELRKENGHFVNGSTGDAQLVKEEE